MNLFLLMFWVNNGTALFYGAVGEKHLS